MIKKICYFVLLLMAVSIISVVTASTSTSYIEPYNPGEEDMREVSFSETNTYPINSPIPTSPDFEKKKCKLYKVLERVFSEEVIARASCERIPASSGIMNELANAFQKLPITATEIELSEVLIDTFLYLDSFCSGYRSVLLLFKEEVGRGKSYLNANDVNLVLSIPMDLAKKLTLRSELRDLRKSSK